MDFIVDLLKAFLLGGIFCLIGQLLIDFTKLTPARILVGYVVSGVILSGLGLYKPLADMFGAGALVPLSGFGHALANGVKEMIASEGFVGVLKGGLSATSAGICVAMLVAFTVALFFKSKDKSD